MKQLGQRKSMQYMYLMKKMLLTDNDDRRRLFEKCSMKAKTVVNPIIDWPDYKIWDFYQSECKYHNPVYELGFTRVGCIGCPIAGKGRWKEFSNFPKYKNAYINAFRRMLEERSARGLQQKWKSGEEVFLWWMEDDNVPGQISINDLEMDQYGNYALNTKGR